MTNVKSTKRALLTSVMALFLCFAMLLGTTYAWFTDSVYSGSNNIIVGNLDIELEYLTQNGWKTVSNATDLFTDELWEPGHTEVVYLRLKNLGSLALKYKFGVNIVSETYGTNKIGNELRLSDYIYYDVIEGVNGNNPFESREIAVAAAEMPEQIKESFSKEGVMSAGDPELYLALVVYMPTWIGNEASYKTGTVAPKIELGINVVATQLTEEEDPFGNDYDKDATYTAEIDQLKTKLAAAQSGDTVEYALTHDAYIDSMIKVPNGVTLVLNGNGHQAIVNTAYPFYVNNANIQMNDLTITGKATYAIFTKGAIWDYNGNNATVNASFNNVTVDLDKADNYPVVFNGKGEITMTDCTITGAGLSAEGDCRNGTHIFAGAEINLTVYRGTIGGVLMNANNVHNSTLTISDSAVIDTLILATDQTKTATLTNNGGTVNKLIQQVDDAAKLEAALKAGYTAALSKDITMEAHLSSSIVGDINIYGEGHTLTLRGIYSVGGKNVTLSNMTLVDNNPNDYTIYNQGGKVELTNVTYSSSINKAFQLTGGGDVILTNCDISGTVTGTYSASNIWCGDGRNVTVNGGTYGSIFINASNGAGVLSAGKITVNDGTIGKLILETEKNTAGTGYKSAVLVQNGGTITTLVQNPQNYDLTGLTKLN